MLSTIYKNNPTLSIVLSQQNMQKYQQRTARVQCGGSEEFSECFCFRRVLSELTGKTLQLLIALTLDMSPRSLKMHRGGTDVKHIAHA